MSKNRRPKTEPGSEKKSFALVYWTESNEVSVLDSRCVLEKAMLADPSIEGKVEFGTPSVSPPPGGWPQFLAKVIAVSENDAELRKLEDEYVKNGKLLTPPEGRSEGKKQGKNSSSHCEETLLDEKEKLDLVHKMKVLEFQLEEERQKNLTLMKLNWKLQEELIYALKQSRTKMHESLVVTMMNTVLIIYGERKIKVKLPEDQCNLEGLQQEITGDESISNILGNPYELLFQLFDPEFEDYIDINANDSIPDKSKIKVHRMHMQLKIKPHEDASTPKIISASINIKKETSNSQEDLLSTDSETTRSLYVHSDQDESLRDSVAPEFENREFQLPQLPLYIEECLQLNRTPSPGTRKKIIEVIFQKIVSQTIYPGRNTYHNAALALVSKYPCLRDTNDNGFTSWLTALRNKFRNERRKLNGGVVDKMRLRYGKRRRTKSGEIIYSTFDSSPFDEEETVAEQIGLKEML